MALELKNSFDPRHGEPVEMAQQVIRVTAPNAGAFTFHGTNTYIVGGKSLCVIDPGPDDDRHFAALMNAIGDRPVSHILVTHTHLDHSALCPRLKRSTGAIVMAEGPHRAARPLHEGEENHMEAAADRSFQPDRTLADGEEIEGEDWHLRAVHTPGHCANHCAFAMEKDGILFAGDHVMAWSTSIVAPPDGSMEDYMDSLERLLKRQDDFYLPGHGGRISDPQNFVRALKTHRKMREMAIGERLKRGDQTITEIVGTIYRTTDSRLHGAAALSVLAHLEAMHDRGDVVTDTAAPTLDSCYRSVGA